MEQTSKKTIVSLKDIFIKFDGEVILNHINLDINEKEFVTILGPSGCGKTTTLRIIGGFVEPDSGDVIFGGKRINGTPPNKRNVNTVFQKYSLFPHLNVFDNVAFGLKLKKMPKDEIKKRVTDMLATVDLKGYEKRSVAKLSGGQQQRVAIARALVCDPEIILLDEPLGALDLKLRKSMQLELKEIQQKTQKTFIYVTHDQEEALTMSDRVVVMNNGVIEQIGSPEDIYNEPVNAFVADLSVRQIFSTELCLMTAEFKFSAKSLNVLTRDSAGILLLMLSSVPRILKLPLPRTVSLSELLRTQPSRVFTMR